MTASRLLAILVALAVAFVAAPAQADHHEPPRPRVTGFNTLCDWSHAAPDDPIVHRQHEGAAHLHEFFGNTSTNAHTTTKKLRAATTTCTHPDDKAAYWVPALYLDGERVEPANIVAYYRDGPLRNFEDIRPFPFGLRMIAGNSKATGPQPLSVAYWTCTPRNSNAAAAPPESCPSPSTLRLRLSYPNCWDGERLTSSDQSHMRYSRDGYCPRTHPVELPTLRVGHRWPVAGRLGKVTLSSGSVYTAHGDFWNAWTPSVQRALVERCVIEGRFCDFR